MGGFTTKEEGILYERVSRNDLHVILKKDTHDTRIAQNISCAWSRIPKPLLAAPYVAKQAPFPIPLYSPKYILIPGTPQEAGVRIHGLLAIP